MKKDLNLQMFKTYDIRTKASNLSETNRVRLIRAIAKYYLYVIKTDTIVLGRDARLAAPTLMQNAVDLLPRYGINVILNPLQISTCQFYFSCMQNRNCGGLMFTASHNPSPYIGIKLIAPNMETIAMDTGPQGGITAIKEIYEADAPFKTSSCRGKVTVSRYLDQFIDYSLNYAGVKKDSLKGSKILTDYLNGTAGTEITEALSYAGAEVSSRNLIPDGAFPKGAPNPIIISSIQETWDLMKKGDFDFGFCFDGDGDRMDVMNEKGNQIAPCFNMSAIMKELENTYRKIWESGYYGNSNFKLHSYADSKANPIAVSLMANQGIDMQIIRNGHSFIKKALTINSNKQFIGASEESAHYYLNFPYDLKDYSKGLASTENSLFFTLLTAKTWTKHPEIYTSIMKLQNTTFREREWALHFNNVSKMEESLENVEKCFSAKGLKSIKNMGNGNSLDATILRCGLPEKITKDTNFEGQWYQINQRISRSEDNLARWEIVGNNAALVKEAKETISEINAPFIDRKIAQYI